MLLEIFQSTTDSQVVCYIVHSRFSVVTKRLRLLKMHGRGFELGTTENKSSKWPERDRQIVCPTRWYPEGNLRSPALFFHLGNMGMTGNHRY